MENDHKIGKKWLYRLYGKVPTYKKPNRSSKWTAKTTMTAYLEDQRRYIKGIIGMLHAWSSHKSHLEAYDVSFKITFSLISRSNNFVKLSSARKKLATADAYWTQCHHYLNSLIKTKNQCCNTSEWLYKNEIIRHKAIKCYFYE